MKKNQKDALMKDEKHERKFQQRRIGNQNSDLEKLKSSEEIFEDGYQDFMEKDLSYYEDQVEKEKEAGLDKKRREAGLREQNSLDDVLKEAPDNLEPATLAINKALEKNNLDEAKQLQGMNNDDLFTYLEDAYEKEFENGKDKKTRGD